MDRFILARIEAAGLLPALEADRRIWLRRVYFDLIGLPPTPQQSEQFLADPSQDAYERVVDQLLGSPQFGEKWARHWMDLVRYAETYGHEFDYPIQDSYEYRDYLIRAFNADLPYDQFIREQIAGDLLPQPRRHPDAGFNESIIGTGFWYLHEATHAPTDVLGNEAGIIDNQINVFGKAFLGLTVACARCHDHKFDAISTADYYALSAYIQSSCRQRYPLDPGRRIEDATCKIRELRQQAIASLTDLQSEPQRFRPARYYEVAAELLRRAIQSPSGTAINELVLEDFEQGYGNWTVDGEAFGERPATEPIKPQGPFVGAVGRATASSYGGSDHLLGSLTYKPFKIKLPYIHLRVGGGKKRVGVELRIDGKVVRSAKGSNKEDLIQQVWDVTEFEGKEATLRIFDDHQGRWGHINVDQIVASERPPGEGPQATPPKEWIAEAAAANDLELPRLEKWIALLSAPTSDNPIDPGGLLACAARQPADADQLVRRYDDQQRQLEKFRESSVLFADFDSVGLPEGWSTSGQAFCPTGNEIAVSIGGAACPAPGTVDSSLLGTMQAGILRSPTFEITTRNIHVRMRATANVTVNVVIDGYQMARFSGLLFNGTFLKGDATDTKGTWQWKSFGGDLQKYLGHKAYLEFIDEGPAAVAVDEIRFSDQAAPTQSIDELVVSLAAGGDSLDQLWMQAVGDLKASRYNSFLAWLLDKDLVSISDLSRAAGESLAKAGSIARNLPQPRYVLAMAEGTTENAYIYVRGSHTNLGQEVPPRFLQALGGEPGTRLDLANRIASPDNPLTSRVIVNRVWHHLFGRGIVPTVDDFGPQGQPPSHPELLEWLASGFVANGWSLKDLIRSVVLSQTYRQDSVARPRLDPQRIATVDPTNALLYRMRVRRLPAESIHDAILAVSGRLDPTQFGESIATYRTPFMTGRGARGSGPLDGAGRRSVYLSIYRNFLNPFMLTFDMPSPFGPQGRRSTSNVPAQALTLMNDPFVIEQAAVWAEKVLARANLTDQERISLMIQESQGVAPSADQIDAFSQFLRQQADEYGALDKRAWSDLAHALLNMKSFYYLR